MRLSHELAEVTWTHARGEGLSGRHQPILTDGAAGLPQKAGAEGGGLNGPPSPWGYDAAVNEESRKDVIARLRSIAGHLKAVERMVEEDKYCVDVLKQTMAIEKALERVDALVLEQHLETCVADAFRQGRSEKTIKELAEIFTTARK